jgi:hypothetical protein
MTDQSPIGTVCDMATVIWVLTGMLVPVGDELALADRLSELYLTAGAVSCH